MALENRPNNEDSYEMTYIDSDDDNEEGDYTVYECPGLAPVYYKFSTNSLFDNNHLLYTLTMYAYFVDWRNGGKESIVPGRYTCNTITGITEYCSSSHSTATNQEHFSKSSEKLQ